MDVVTINIEEPLIFSINEEIVRLVAFKTAEYGNIKFGIEAPRALKVHREEIYHAIKLKEKISDEK